METGGEMRCVRWGKKGAERDGFTPLSEGWTSSGQGMVWF